MAQLEDLERQAKEQAKVVEGQVVDEAYDPDDFIRQDILDALTIIERCQTMFSYMKDPILCKGISVRERAAMERIVMDIKEWVGERSEYLEEE